MLELFILATMLYVQSNFFHTNFVFGYIIFFVQILILKNCNAFIFDALNNHSIHTFVLLNFFGLLKNSFLIQNVVFSVSSSTILCINLKIFLICVFINSY